MQFLADEDFHGDILRGVLRQLPNLDVLRVQDVGLGHTHDAVILERAAADGRLVLTHDVNTMLNEAFTRVRAGLPMPGIVVVPQDIDIGRAIEEIVLLAGASLEGEWEGRAIFIPM